MSDFNVEVVPTSNPNIIKFNSNSFLTKARSFEFHNIDEAKQSPLAQQLFYLPFVKTIYISQNFVAIEKFNIVEWEDVQDEVAQTIQEYLESGNPVIKEESQPAEAKKIPVSLYAESTPNPAVMQFIANAPIVDTIYEFKHVSEAGKSPLAKELFGFTFIKEVFFNRNTISLMKHDFVQWEEITNELRSFLTNYLRDGKPVLETTTDTGNSQATAPKTELEEEIVEILKEYVAPAVARDGGHIQFNSYDPRTKTVSVILQGACSGCPSSTVTLKNGIENLLKQLLKGEVQSVVAING